MKIGITGSKGVLGQYFLDLYKNNPEIITCYHDRMENVKALENWLMEQKPDVLLHFAAVVPVQKCENEPEFAIQTNVTGTANLLRIVRDVCSKAWVFIPSSSHIYKTSERKLSENSVADPATFYGITKLFQEKTALSLSKLWNLHICVGRIFSFSGKGQKETYFFPAIIRKIKGAPVGSRVEFFGGGNVRDFLSASEVVHSVDKLMKKRFCGVVNICGGQGLKIEFLIRAIVKIMKREDLEIVVQKDKKSTRLIGNNILLKKIIRYDPKLDLSGLIREISD